jgi:hydrogenase nickel incorporation protein HypA/HybF
MHEMAIAEGILTVVLEAAQTHPVNRVRVKIGALHAVVPDSLRFSFQLAADGTEAQDAIVEIEEVPAGFHCRMCNAEGRLESPSFYCQTCGSPEITMISGEELTVESVEREDGAVLVRAASDRDTMTDALREHIVNEHRPRGD